MYELLGNYFVTREDFLSAEAAYSAAPGSFERERISLRLPARWKEDLKRRKELAAKARRPLSSP